MSTPSFRLFAHTLTAVLTLFAGIAPAEIISVNIAFQESGNTAVDATETFGVPELGTVVGNWNNLSTGKALIKDDGGSSSVSVAVNAPAGYDYFGAGYINTPLNYGIVRYGGTPTSTSLAFSNLLEEFPEGYYVVVYLTGFAGNTGGSVSVGSETYYYQTAAKVPATFSPQDLILTTASQAPAAGQAPVAQYAVFGSEQSPLRGDSIQIELGHLSGGGNGLGGVQLVGVGDSGGNNGGSDEIVFTDISEGTYFFDAVNGNDSNDGLSPETAWKTPGKLDTVQLSPGDVVLFKANDTYTGRFYVWGSGTPENPIVFGAYGTGSRPKLQGGANDLEVIYVTSDSGFEFRDLEISNYHPNGTIAHRYGINIIASPGSGDLRHYHFHNLHFTYIEGSDPENESRAIDATVTGFSGDPDSLRARFNGFVVENCYFAHIDGRAVQLNDYNQSLADKKIRGSNYYPTIGFVFQNNVGMNINRNMLQLGGTQGAIIQYNYMSGTEEGSAFWPFDTEGTIVQFNDFRHLRNPKADSYVCHFDYNCIDTVMQYNFGYDVDGGLIEIIVNSQFQFYQEDAIARYNIGVDVGFRNAKNSAGIFLTGRVTRSKVYNNTIVNRDLHSAYKGISVNNWGGEWPDNNEIYNNIIYAAGSPTTFADVDRLAQKGNILSHNLYYGNLTVPSADVFPITGDPLLVNPAGMDPEDFKLQEGSPAIGAGKTIANNGGRDFFNNPVPADLTPSLGFHEAQTEGQGRWAGFDVDLGGNINTGMGFMGWLVRKDESGWLYSYSAHQYIYAPETFISSGSGAWIYLIDQAKLNPDRVVEKWYIAQVFNTWVASYGDSIGSGPGWLYVYDLRAYQ